MRRRLTALVGLVLRVWTYEREYSFKYLLWKLYICAALGIAESVFHLLIVVRARQEPVRIRCATRLLLPFEPLHEESHFS